MTTTTRRSIEDLNGACIDRSIRSIDQTTTSDQATRWDVGVIDAWCPRLARLCLSPLGFFPQHLRTRAWTHTQIDRHTHGLPACRPASIDIHLTQTHHHPSINRQSDRPCTTGASSGGRCSCGRRPPRHGKRLPRPHFLDRPQARRVTYTPTHAASTKSTGRQHPSLRPSGDARWPRRPRRHRPPPSTKPRSVRTYTSVRRRPQTPQTFNTHKTHRTNKNPGEKVWGLRSGMVGGRARHAAPGRAARERGGALARAESRAGPLHRRCGHRERR